MCHLYFDFFVPKQLHLYLIVCVGGLSSFYYSSHLFPLVINGEKDFVLLLMTSIDLTDSNLFWFYINMNVYTTFTEPTKVYLAMTKIMPCRCRSWSNQSINGATIDHHSLMRLMVMGETLAFARASLKVFCLRLRFTWGFITILESLGSLIRVWKKKKAHSN